MEFIDENGGVMDVRSRTTTKGNGRKKVPRHAAFKVHPVGDVRIGTVDVPLRSNSLVRIVYYGNIHK